MDEEREREKKKFSFTRIVAHAPILIALIHFTNDDDCCCCALSLLMLKKNLKKAKTKNCTQAIVSIFVRPLARSLSLSLIAHKQTQKKIFFFTKTAGELLACCLFSSSSRQQQQQHPHCTQKQKLNRERARARERECAADWTNKLISNLYIFAGARFYTERLHACIFNAWSKTKKNLIDQLLMKEREREKVHTMLIKIDYHHRHLSFNNKSLTTTTKKQNAQPKTKKNLSNVQRCVMR